MSPLLPRRQLRSASATVIEQALVSAGMFVIHLLLARMTPAADYGVFVLTYSAIVFANELFHAFLHEPMMVFGAGESGQVRQRYLGSALAMQLLLTAGAAIMIWVGAAAWTLVYGPGPAVGTVAWMAVGLCGVQLREFTRKALYTRFEPVDAFRNAALYSLLLLTGVGVALKLGAFDARAAYATLGLSGITASIVALRKASITPFQERANTAAVAQNSMRYGRWMIGAAVARWASNELYYFVVAGFVGAAGTGALRAVQNVFLPVNLFLVGLSNLLLPTATRLVGAGSPTAIRQFVLRVGGGFSLLVIGYVAAVALAGQVVFSVLYAGAYSDYAYLIPILGLGHTLMAGLQGATISLRALNRPATILVISVLSAAVASGAVVPLTERWGVTGAALTWVLGFAVAAPFWLFASLRAAAGSRPVTAPVQPAVFDQQLNEG